jgi:hypothetical protein
MLAWLVLRRRTDTRALEEMASFWRHQPTPMGSGFKIPSKRNQILSKCNQILGKCNRDPVTFDS